MPEQGAPAQPPSPAANAPAGTAPADSARAAKRRGRIAIGVTAVLAVAAVAVAAVVAYGPFGQDPDVAQEVEPASIEELVEEPEAPEGQPSPDAESDSAADSATAESEPKEQVVVWYYTSLVPSAEGAFGPAVTRASYNGDSLTLEGSMRVAESQDEPQTIEIDAPVEGPDTWTFAVADDAELLGAGGEDPDHPNEIPYSTYDRETFFQVVESLNGLGLELKVVDGTIVYACLWS